jgi:hypothetical protein
VQDSSSLSGWSDDARQQRLLSEQQRLERIAKRTQGLTEVRQAAVQSACICYINVFYTGDR